MELPKQIAEFKDVDSMDLLNPDFGSKNFEEIKPSFDESYLLIAEMVEIVFDSEDFPDGIRNQVLNIVTRFNGFHKEIRSYSIDKDGSNQFRGRQNIINNFRD